MLIDVPKDIVDPKNPRSAMDWYWPSDEDIEPGLPGYKPNTKGHPRMIKEAARLILESSKPVIYAGGGILKARAAEALKELAELTGIPVVTTLMARGAFPDGHPLCLGMPGMHGNYTAVTAMQKSDLLIALGSRFDDRVTGKLDGFAPDAKIIHVDIDPAELGKVRRPDVPIVGDCRLVIEELVKAVRAHRRGDHSPTARRGDRTIRGWQEKLPAHLRPGPGEGDALKPQMVLETLRDSAPEDTIVASGVGQHQMWTSQYWKFDHPYTWVNSGGLGTMGFSVPAAIGAKVGRPDRMVWAIDGDGCFQMTAQELVTAAAERIPVKIAILNNAYLGMVRQWQEMFYEERYSEVYLSPDLPDYVKWAEAMGCVAFRVEHPDDVQTTIDKANAIDDRPVVVDFRTDSSEKVFPMVPAGHDQRARSSSIPRRARVVTDDDAAHGRAPHPLRPRREQGRRARPRRQPVRPARLQHLLPRRRPDRRRALQPHHHRGRRRVVAPRADHQAAVQADQRRQDQRARPCDSVERELMLMHGQGRRPPRAARSSSSCRSSRARSSTSATTSSP